jgi:hypothetical protein
MRTCTSGPRVCPRRANSVEHTIDTSRTVGVSQVEEQAVAVNNLRCPLDRMLTSEETVLLELKPGMGSAPCAMSYRSRMEVRDQHAQQTGVRVCYDGPRQRGDHENGGTVSVCPLASEVGIGGHLDQMLVGDQALRFGSLTTQTASCSRSLRNDLYV